MGIKVKFVQDETIDDIEVVVKAKVRSDMVERIIKDLGEIDNNSPCDVLINEDFLDTKKIVIISKIGRYLSIKTTEREYVINEPLYKIEEKLDPKWFVKISQSEIVNLRFVKKWDFDGGGIIKIELTNGLCSYTSRRYAVIIKKILKNGGRTK